MDESFVRTPSSNFDSFIFSSFYLNITLRIDKRYKVKTIPVWTKDNRKQMPTPSFKAEDRKR